jgi:hypothetical protein
MAKKPRENKTGVYIFRLPTSSDATLIKDFESVPIVGITSVNLFARKIIMDYLSGRLAYLEPASKLDNPLLKRAESSIAHQQG